MPDWEWLPTLSGGQTPIVLDEEGDFDNGDGIRVTLVPHHLVIEVATENKAGWMILPLDELLEAMGEMAQKAGS